MRLFRLRTGSGSGECEVIQAEDWLRVRRVRLFRLRTGSGSGG